MLQELQRPLRAEERQSLTRVLNEVPRIVTLSATLRWFALWAGILALCLFLFAISMSRLEGPSGIWMVVLPFVVITGILSFYGAYMVVSGHFRWSGYARRFARDSAPRIRAALEDGRASVVQITSDQVIVIDESEDKGSAHIFDLGDGTSFYLRGQFYCPDDTTAPWPSRHFELVYTVLNRRLVGIFSARDPVEQVRRVPMAEMPKSFWFSDKPATETILPGRAEEVLE